MTRSVPSVLAGLIPALVLLSPSPLPAQDAAAGAWRPPDLVDAVASFGAVAHDGALYVYGGHVGRTHMHSMENISPGFRRLVLEPGRTWEELARGPLLQGAALVSDGAAIYRVGGMTAANATGEEPEVLRSSRSAARYSIAEDQCRGRAAPVQGDPRLGHQGDTGRVHVRLMRLARQADRQR